MTLLGRAALCVFLIRLYLLCLCVVAAPTAALAQKSPGANTALVVLTDQTSAYPLSGRSEFWIDPTGQASVNDVDTQQNSLGFALRGDKAELLHGRALWIRFAVRSDRLANTRWFLEMPLAGVDQVTLHHRNAAGQWQAQSAGDRLPQAQWPQAGRYPVFQLQDDPQLTTYLVQVRHARVPFSGRLQIVSQTHLITQHETEQFYLGAYFGLAVLVVLVAAVTALFNRDLGFGSYACYVAALAGAQAAFTGIAPQHVWPHLPAVGNGAVFFLPVLAAAPVRSVSRSARTRAMHGSSSSVPRRRAYSDPAPWTTGSRRPPSFSSSLATQPPSASRAVRLRAASLGALRSASITLCAGGRHEAIRLIERAAPKPSQRQARTARHGATTMQKVRTRRARVCERRVGRARARSGTTTWASSRLAKKPRRASAAALVAGTEIPTWEAERKTLASSDIGAGAGDAHDVAFGWDRRCATVGSSWCSRNRGKGRFRAADWCAKARSETRRRSAGRRGTGWEIGTVCAVTRR